MKQLSVAAIALVLLVCASAYADDGVQHVQPADPVVQKQLLDEVRSLLHVIRTGLEKLESVPDKLSLAVYYAGVKDGALGAVLALVLIYLVFLHRKAS